MQINNIQPPSGLINLANERMGANVLYVTDEFFAQAENLLKPGRGIFLVDKYTDNGKWMDGWESRRKRTEGYDYCVIKLGVKGRIQLLDVDTNHFLGNHPPFCSVDAINWDGSDEDLQNTNSDKLNWVEILSKSPLQAGSQNIFPARGIDSYSHIRLNIYPDGGVARLKVYGSADLNSAATSERTNLIAIENGATAVACNDMFFSPMENLLYPEKGKNMGDGWETRRKRGPGNDWVIIKLAKPGTVDDILIDTSHFKGNFPDSASVEGIFYDNSDPYPEWSTLQWKTILKQSKLEGHSESTFKTENNTLKVTHLRLSIYPDGGISRFKAFGKFS